MNRKRYVACSLAVVRCLALLDGGGSCSEDTSETEEQTDTSSGTSSGTFHSLFLKKAATAQDWSWRWMERR